MNPMFEIRKITSSEVNEALSLALEVFMQFEAPDYKPEGVETFKRDIIENEEFIAKCRSGACPIYTAFDNGKIIGLNGLPFYLKLGFVPQSEELEQDGIRYTPMKYMV